MNVGDTIICIDNEDYEDVLTVRWEYLVDELMGQHGVRVNGLPTYFDKSRFIVKSQSYSNGGVIPKTSTIVDWANLQSKQLGILPQSATTDNGTVDVWTEEEIGLFPLKYNLDKECDMGCQAIGDTHYETCKAYDPHKTVPFG